MHPTSRIKVIIDRINREEATEEEILEFNEWYNSFDDSHVYLKTDHSINEIGMQIWDRLDSKVSDKKVINWRKVYSIAAAAAVIFFSGIYFYTMEDSTVDSISSSTLLTINGTLTSIHMDENQFLDSTYYHSLVLVPVKTLEVKTTKGNQTKLVLPDGSKVVLNSASKLYLEEGIALDSTQCIANVFGGSDRTCVEISVNNGEWSEMKKTRQVDPLITSILLKNKTKIYPTEGNTVLPLRASNSNHIWTIELNQKELNEVMSIRIRAKDDYGYNVEQQFMLNTRK